MSVSGDTPNPQTNNNNSSEDNDYIKKYMKIDQKNIFQEMDKECRIVIKGKYNKYKDNETHKSENTKVILNYILDKICNSAITDDIFTISSNICKQIPKNNKLNKNSIDEIISKLLDKNIINTYKNKLMKLNIENCEVIGSLLCYSYLRLQQEYKIKDMNKLLEIRKNIFSKNVDVVKDFSKYSKETKDSDEKIKKITYFWKKKRSSYECLPELIFLFNRYSLVTEIEIDFNLFENISEDQTKFIEMTFLNMHLVFKSLKRFKISLINESLQQDLYIYYTKKINNFCSETNETYKLNNLINKNEIFQKKWNFKDCFKLEEYRKLENKENNSLYSNLIQCLDFNKPLDENSNDDVNNMSSCDPKRMMTINNIGNIIQRLNSDAAPKNNDNKINKNAERSSVKSTDNIKNYDKYKTIVKNYYNLFELIIIALFSYNNESHKINMELIMNDSYTIEFLEQFIFYYKIEGLRKNVEDFNILDLLIYNDNMKNINTFNIEINCLDPISFDKILNLLYYNHSIKSFYMSFFSSDVTYFTQCLYKLCRGAFDDNFLKENDEISNNYADIEEKILKAFSSDFKTHLLVLFDIFQKMENLEEIGLNFDVPCNLIDKSFYMNSILKFILNILFYFSNNKVIKKFCLLSPKTIINSKSISNIDNIISSINIDNAPLLTDLSIQFQFYHIENINNFVSTKLKILNIGDLDMDTFKALCNNILSLSFNQNSSLEKLSIGLVRSIIDFNIELKILLRRLFNIKLKNLVSFGLYTNIYISDEIEYDYLLKILNNNWISEYTIFFNDKSKQQMKNFYKDVKNLKFYIPHHLEGKLLESDDIMKMQDNPVILEIDNNKDYYDGAFWSLKYVFKKLYIDEFTNEQRIKDIVMGILKYLYFIKVPKINC